jgi:hypothetical protein
MQVKFEMMPLEKIVLGNESNFVNLIDVVNTVNNTLNARETKKYVEANIKVMTGRTLAREDVLLYDRIDAITMEKHGLCLKDSKVTKARLKACRKYSIKFNDRDGLVDHMKFFTQKPFTNNQTH